MKNLLKGIIASCLLLLTSLTYAESETTDSSAWDFTFTPYLWATTLETDVGTTSIPSVESQINFKNLLDLVEIAWMSSFEARHKNSRWGFMNEIIYMRVNDDQNFSVNGPVTGRWQFDGEVDITMKEGLSDFLATYYPEAMPNLTLFGGMRYVLVHTKIDLEGDVRRPILADIPVNSAVKHNEDWIDPVIGARYSQAINDKWQWMIRGDISGGNDLEFGSLLTAGLAYKMTKGTEFRFGYRYGRLDYDSSDFVFDQTLNGAIAGVSFKF